MQLDGPAATERQLWNWKDNIDGGKLIRDIKRIVAKRHLDEYGNYPPEYITQSMFQLYNGRHLRASLKTQIKAKQNMIKPKRKSKVVFLQ
ncbi:MAG: hypothetical protein WAV89_03345 [Ignavibacteriaceae bacterium]